MAMRSIQNLDISLGLFSFPVKVYKAADDPNEGISFRQVHTCGTPVQYIKRCAACAADVPHTDLRKGFETAPGQFLLFTEEEVRALRPDRLGVVTIVGYVAGTRADGVATDAADGIDPAYYDGTAYYLAPGGKDATAFATFRNALQDRWALGRVVFSGRDRLCAIRALDRLLMLHLLRPQIELRAATAVPGYAAIPEQAAAQHLTLMDQLMAGRLVALDDVILDADSYRTAVLALIEARKAGQPVPAEPATGSAPPAGDLLTMLKASLAKAAASAA